MLFFTAWLSVESLLMRRLGSADWGDMPFGPLILSLSLAETAHDVPCE